MKSTVLKVSIGEKCMIEMGRFKAPIEGPATLIVLTEEDKADMPGPDPYTELGPGMEVELQAKEEEKCKISEAEMTEAIVRAFITAFCKPDNTDEAPHPINTSIFHISPTLEDAKAFSQARVQGLLGKESKLKATLTSKAIDGWCPRCENEEVQPEDNYCGICGLQLREV